MSERHVLTKKYDIRGEGFAYFRWHCLQWPGVSLPPMRPCEFKTGWECYREWRELNP